MLAPSIHNSDRTHQICEEFSFRLSKVEWAAAFFSFSDFICFIFADTVVACHLERIAQCPPSFHSFDSRLAAIAVAADVFLSHIFFWWL